MTAEVAPPPAEAHPSVHGMARLIRQAAADPSARPTLLHRVILVIATFSMFSTLIGASGPTVRWPALGIAVTLAICALVVVVVAGFTVRTMRWFGRAEMLLALLAVVGLSLWMLANIFNFTGYRSDEEIFVQYSANLLRHGHNPYSADLMPAYAQYPSPFPTKLLDGSITHRLDYPALPTLLTTVLTMIVGDFHTVALLCTLALFLTVFVMFRLLPRGMRSLGALLIAGVPVLATGAAGGLLFALVIPPLAFVAYRWQHIGESGRLSKMDLAKAAAIGVVISTTQVGWFPIPFLFLGIYLGRRKQLGSRAAAIVTGKFIGGAAATFLVINAAFIAWSPKDWLRGVFAPLTQHAVPEGSGLINMIQSLSRGSGNLSYYTYAGALVMVGLLVAYWRHFDRLGTACFALPLIGLLFPTRSYWTYFIAYSAAWVVELLSHDPEPAEAAADAAAAAESAESDEADRSDGPDGSDAARDKPKAVPLTPRIPWLTRSAAVTTAAFLPAAVVFGAAVTSKQPLTLRLDSYQTSAQLGTVQSVTLLASNNSGETLTPHFMAIHNNGMVSATWNIVSGPTKLSPHSKAQYTVTAPSSTSMPLLLGGLKMQAVTDTPATVSYSSTLNTQPYITVLVGPTPVLPLLDAGASTVLTARVQSAFGEPVERAGMRVCLDQAKFTNGNVDFDSADISPSPAGDSSKCGFTDKKGEVRFTVKSNGSNNHQLYFQSYGQQGSYGRFGYSTFLSVAWR
ncbi:MAG: hypothetical protein HOV83_22460 [Catenulispora sp.]|nr:hypothetical protein [Catenulispora sp.]